MTTDYIDGERKFLLCWGSIFARKHTLRKLLKFVIAMVTLHDDDSDIYVLDPNIFWSILHEERNTVAMFESNAAQNNDYQDCQEYVL